MLKLSRICCTAMVVIFLSLFIFSSGYAKRTISTSKTIKIEGTKNYPDPIKTKHPGIPDTYLSIGMDGVEAEGYTQGLITAHIDELDFDVLKEMPSVDRNILSKLQFSVEARCAKSGKKIDLDPGVTLTCDKNEGFEMDVFQPKSPHKAVFTITQTKEIDDEEELVVKKNSTQTSFSNVPEVLQQKSLSSFVTGSGSVNSKKGCIIQ